MSGPFSAGVITSTVPIFELSGQWLGASVPKPASASEQADWPSAASGLIERPAGRVRDAERSCDGRVGVAEDLFGDQRRLRPLGESASVVVRPTLKTGRKTSVLQPVVSG